MVPAGVNTASCSQIAVETIRWMAPIKAGDNSSLEVSEEVLRLGGAATRLIALGGGRVDPPPTGIRDVLLATC
ncbi:UNVERIFIED_CONTAM: hypothetical protein Sradi_1532100 [Sesamum radiatum]|uniref:Uncharacterized protein n=1 Tax=Sesamum radiatum TaxID=300843 RepID=A0AAW2U7Z4_SESRA